MSGPRASLGKSTKQGLLIRRILLKDGTAYSIRPSFLMPYMTGRTKDVEGPLSLRKFGVPFWALARVFGRDPMSWYRLECGLGRSNLVGTTVRQAELPAHLLADEHHQVLDGQRLYIATTVGGGCILGAEPADAAGADDLEATYGAFKDEARDIAPQYAPQPVSTDGWKGTQAAWKALFPKVIILLCFLHAWLKIRDRAKHLKGVFAEVSRRVWEAYHAPDRRSLGNGSAGFGPGRPDIFPGSSWRRSWTCAASAAVVDRVPPSRRPLHEHHVGSPDAGDEPLLRPRPTPPRLAGGVPHALPRVGVVVELRALAPGDDEAEPGLALPRRTPQSTPLS